ncbi:hypothetical protein B0H13DRAFT_1903826 [Mycena leptocephala]|nr:hypothetical protein B0H13DRAFT_1903826 [Mycena leptocephala]
MDRFYDIARAGTKLDEISKVRRLALNAVLKPGVKHLADLDADEVRIVDTGNRNSWRMCVETDGDEVLDEVVFRVQGVLLKNNLTPKNTESCPPRKVAFICQHLEICGLSSEVFKAAVAKTEEVNDRFSEHFSSVTVVSLARPSTGLGPALSASNRLFTQKGDAPTEQDNDFVDGVDPTGSLERLKTRDLIHAPENMVRYFKCVPDTSNEQVSHSKAESLFADEMDRDKVRYEPTVPGIFKVGDIVELQVSFVGIQTAHH